MQLKIGVDMPAGTKTLPDPFVSFSYIEVLFKQMNVGQTIFEYDLGTQLDDLADLGCQFEDGLVPILNKELQCVLHHGESTVPTITDYAIVTIKNYKALIAGD